VRIEQTRTEVNTLLAKVSTQFQQENIPQDCLLQFQQVVIKLENAMLNVNSTCEFGGDVTLGGKQEAIEGDIKVVQEAISEIHFFLKKFKEVYGKNNKEVADYLKNIKKSLTLFISEEIRGLESKLLKEQVCATQLNATQTQPKQDDKKMQISGDPLAGTSRQEKQKANKKGLTPYFKPKYTITAT